VLLSATPAPLRVGAIGQETSAWCWAAAAEMIMVYVGGPARRVTQARQATDAARKRQQYVTCLAGSCRAVQPRACLQGGYPTFGDYDFEKPLDTVHPLSLPRLARELAKRPIAFSYEYGPNGIDGAHMLVGIGLGKDAVKGVDTIMVLDPYSAESETCRPRRGQVSYRYYRREHDLTIYCIKVKGDLTECRPGDDAEPLPTPAPPPPAEPTAEAAARAALEQFAELRILLTDKDDLAGSGIGHSARLETLATDEIRRWSGGLPQEAKWIRPPTERRVFPVRDAGGWYALVTVERVGPTEWEPVAMFEDRRAAAIEAQLGLHDPGGEGRVGLMLVPGLNLEFLDVPGPPESRLHPLINDPGLGIRLDRPLSLTDAARTIRTSVQRLNRDPT
jgi:hypothetical protein